MGWRAVAGARMFLVEILLSGCRGGRDFGLYGQNSCDGPPWRAGFLWQFAVWVSCWAERLEKRKLSPIVLSVNRKK